MGDTEIGPGAKTKFVAFALITLLAVVVRLANYLPNHSLVHDDAAVAVNLIYHSYAELRNPLDFWVVAPLGFLYAEKAIGQPFAYSEFSLRFLPLLASFALIPAYLFIADQLFNFFTACIGGLLLATNWRLTEWSARVKPYSLDSLLALITLYIICTGIRRGWPARYLIIAALYGTIAPWFSFPLTIVLAGMGAVAIIHSIHHHSWRTFFVLSAICVLWLASFVLDQSLAMNIGSNKSHIDPLWLQYFMPYSWHAIAWIPWAITMIFSQTIRLGPWPGFPLIALIGSLLILRGRPGSPVLLAVSPIIPAFFASALNKYPFGDRVLLYIVPLLILVMSAGIAEMLHRRSMLAKCLAIAAFSVMFLPDFATAISRSFHPPVPDDTRPVYAYIVKHHQPGDQIYVALFAIPTYEYYAPRIGLNDLPAHLGTGTDPDQLQTDLSPITGRVWLVSDLLNVDITNHSFRQLLHLAQTRGNELDHFKIEYVEAHLFDLDR